MPERNSFARLRRRGSIYAMVLGISMLITIIGIGALATSRVSTRQASVSLDWEEAGAMAASAVEQAIAKLNADATANPLTWRDAYTNGTVGYSATFGRGTLRWVLVDESDGVLNDNYTQSIRVYGIGSVGTTRRVYSVQLTASGEGIDVLKTAMHSSDGLNLGGKTFIIGAPISTNGNLSNATNLYGGYGTEVVGTGGTVAAAKPMPSATVFDTYKARATVIPSSVVSSSDLLPGVLSASSNPYGAVNPDGIYYILLPDSRSAVRLDSSCIKGTLLVEAGNSAQSFEIGADVYWEPASSGYATLITKGIKALTIKGKAAPFSSNYPSEIRGLIHAIGTSTVLIDDRAYLKGCLVADGTISTNGNVGITYTSSLFSDPPMGYTKGNRILPNPGTWKWDTLPAGVN